MFDEIQYSIPYQYIYYKNVQLCIKRLDLVHPEISGNKFFKLKYNFLEAHQQGMSKVLTFGGAYSNHIAATAYAAHRYGFESVGIIRGEELAYKPLNQTLARAQKMGMQLHYVSRENYRQKNNNAYLDELKQTFAAHYIIPEGGTNAFAIQGCQEILSTDDLQNFDVFCCAVGTGGTITGLIEATAPPQQIWGFSALKGDFLSQEVKKLTSKNHWQITDAYCMGGYAKTSAKLVQFMQDFEAKYQIPLEQIYTAKMMWGIFDLIDQGKISIQTRILILHTGGLQGRIVPA